MGCAFFVKMQEVVRKMSRFDGEIEQQKELYVAQKGIYDVQFIMNNLENENRETNCRTNISGI